MSIKILTPVGRLVSGHPMELNPEIDDVTKQPKLDKNHQPMNKSYVGVAIPKKGEQHWNQTEWGAQIYQLAQTEWINGEFQRPDFAWKIEDGDSTIPNKNNIKNCDREGFPGHWIIHASTFIGIGCFHRDRYEPHLAIQNKNEIKRGDYCRVYLEVAKNGAKAGQTAGLYLNPQLFELYQSGIEIKSANAPDAAAAFGQAAGALPPGAQVDPNAPPVPAAVPGAVPPAAPAAVPPAVPGNAAPPPAAPAPAPATDLVPPQAPEQFDYNGSVYTRDQLRAGGWSDAQIDTLTRV